MAKQHETASECVWECYNACGRQWGSRVVSTGTLLCSRHSSAQRAIRAAAPLCVALAEPRQQGDHQQAHRRCDARPPSPSVRLSSPLSLVATDGTQQLVLLCATLTKQARMQLQYQATESVRRLQAPVHQRRPPGPPAHQTVGSPTLPLLLSDLPCPPLPLPLSP